MDFKKWTIKQLKDEAKALHQTIYQVGCYGCKDLIMYDSILNELESRGVNVSTRLSI